MGNILRGPLDGRVEARATLVRNMSEPAAGGSDSIAVADVFENDGVEGKIAGVRFDAVTSTTVITVSADLPAASLAGRPVGLGKGKNPQWRVIQRASAREIVVWGRLEAETKAATDFTVLRTFSLKPDAPAGIGARVSAK